MADDTALLDLADPGTNRMIRNYIATLKGLYWFELRKCREQRTSPQNRYFHGPVLFEASKRLSETQGKIWDTERTKSFFKDRFLRRSVVDKNTGEVMGYYTARTRDLNVEEFAEFLDQVILFCAEQLDWIITLPNDVRSKSLSASVRAV